MAEEARELRVQAAVRRAAPPGVPPAPPGAGPPAGADPVAYRGRLLKTRLRAATMAYRAALAAGAVDPVVVIASALLSGATYDATTHWPPDFNPAAHGCICQPRGSELTPANPAGGRGNEATAAE